MRVLHISAGNLYGGVETLLVTLAANRRYSLDIESHFGVCFQGRFSTELSASGAPTHVLGAARTSQPWSIWQVRRNLRRLLKNRRFDAVICHLAWAQAVFAPAVRAERVPQLMWLHDPPDATHTHWLERWAKLSTPDFVVCNSRYTQARLERIYTGVESEVLYCPIAPATPISNAERAEIRDWFQTPPGSVVIAQVSRLERHKGHANHLRALSTLRNRDKWVCWISGAPQRPHEALLLQDLKDLAKQLNISDRVRFVGWQPDIRRVIAAADVFCQPNAAPEPFGISFVEALWAGVPVVSTAQGGALEIVERDCGILVRPDSAGELSQALELLLNDASLRKRMADASRKRAEDLCDPRTQMPKLAALLKRLTATDSARAIAE